ncbi:hypothetical protein Ahy_A03g015866 isoform C [Arachis hypogaea]|uniref:Uncharacterized protein n=1 Tax=Arachis hypogaea TaxID=3818 RepID=A0A445E1V8_ARAHY|nr:hypothetical protein Ahy_A03g015866 isoform C [Arachis hypogaea]
MLQALPLDSNEEWHQLLLGKANVHKELALGVKSITFPLSVKLGLKVDHGIPVVQCITASYFLPDGLFRAAPSGVL